MPISGRLHPDMQEAEELVGHALPVRVDRIKLVGGVGMGLLPARLVADKETTCAVLSEQPFQLPDVLICGCHGPVTFWGLWSVWSVWPVSRQSP